MKRTEIIAAFRAEVDDLAQPYLWTETEVDRYLNDSVVEAAIRAKLIRDSTTTAVCVVAVVANTASYTLDASVIDVERARLDLDSQPLTITSTQEMDFLQAGWERASGSPRYILVDQEADRFKVTLAPKPKVNDTLRLTVFRTPLATEIQNSPDDSPPIPARYHERLVDWMVRCAYLKRDAETLDEKKSLDAEARFTRNFGVRIDANVLRKQTAKHRRQVAFREF